MHTTIGDKRKRTTGVRAVSWLAVALAMTAVPAAAQLSGSAVTTAGSSCTGANNSSGFCGFSASVVTSTGVTFATRYAWNINADVGAFTTRDTSSSAQHNLSFTATAVGGYQLSIATSRVGDMNRLSDLLLCSGSADTGAIAGSSNITLTTGALGLADPGGIGTGGGTTTVPFSQAGAATICRTSNGVGQAHALTFTWSGSVRSNSCEAAVRQGASNGTTTGCTACGYAGSPARTQATDGHFVTVTFTSLCGNSVIDACAGETCDEGGANGSPLSCCTSTCTLRSAGDLCRAAAGVCDLAEICNGSTGACPLDSVASAFVQCRSAAGDCDVAENCTGVGVNCPADGFKASTVVCRPSAGVCDVTDNCTGTGPTCPADAKSTALCRPVADVCDAPDFCDGINNACPADGFLPGGTVCRPSVGVCDFTELCTGTGSACPPDAKSTFVCRAPASICDQPESCDGVGNDCPPDSVTGAFVLCRPATDVCDVDEFCDGTNNICPPDSVAGAFVTCRPSAGECDVIENCDGVMKPCPPDGFLPNNTPCTDDGSVCTNEKCDGNGPLCQHIPGNAGLVCRPASDVCDVDEECDGVNPLCPPDSVAGAFVECRPDAGQCDVADFCDGVNKPCPPDEFEPDGTVCIDGNACTMDTCQNGICVGVVDLDACLDEFLCYKAVNTKGTAKLPILTGGAALSLVDQFESTSFDGDFFKTFCTPANKNNVPIIDPDTHLRGRLIRPNPASVPQSFVRRYGIQVSNQFGPFTVDIIRREQLLTPANKSLTPPAPPAPNPLNHEVDHYKCYKAKRTDAKFIPINVTIEDQFRSPAGTFTVVKPKRLCTPVDKNGEGILHANRHLVCYKVKPAAGTPLFVRRNGVQVTSQFGSESLDVIKELELCIPSEKFL